MNQQPVHRRRMTRAELRRRRRNRVLCRGAALIFAACVATGGLTFLFHRRGQNAAVLPSCKYLQQDAGIL